MTYQGSKARYAKYICPIIQKVINDNKIDTFIDCFVGGANIIKNIQCKNRIGIDNNKYLIALWKFLQEHPNFQFPPYPSREEWDRCKNGEETEDWMVGLVSIFCSNMAGGFPAGYDKMARYDGRIKTCKKDLPLLDDVIFYNKDYHSIEEYSNCVIYCDPPYANTRKYNYQKFNSDDFWNFARKISTENYVFISEQSAPNDFIPIWSMEVKYNIRGNMRIATENLFVYKGGKYVL